MKANKERKKRRNYRKNEKRERKKKRTREERKIEQIVRKGKWKKSPKEKINVEFQVHRMVVTMSPIFFGYNAGFSLDLS
jgi:hypothetical protein